MAHVFSAFAPFPTLRSPPAHKMANRKAVAELPRFLIPRTALSHVATKGAASQLRPRIRSNHDRPNVHPLRRLPQTEEFHTSPPPRYALVICPQSGSSKQSTRRSTPISLDAPPIRHNGVYVASFKSAKRAFSTTRAQQKDHHFDTLKFVQRLKGEGFSEEQAVAMMRVLNDVIEESIQNLTRTMVLKEGIGL
jgi:Protein of unknown function (DUF1640)